MPKAKHNQVIFIFSKMAADRDHLRDYLSENGKTIVCFEKETICFDNLKSIQPDVVVAKTDSDDTVWRFIFALYALGVRSALFIVSDVIKNSQLKSIGFDVAVQCLANSEFNNGFRERMDKFFGGGDKFKKAYLPPIVGQNDEIINIQRMLPSLANSNAPILITGEKGTGRELLARRVALLSGLQEAFVKFNCKDLSSEMVAQYTFAEESASLYDGQSVVVLLEDVHLLKQSAQAELLLLLDRPDKWMAGKDVGGKSSIRFIATAQNSLERLVAQGKFRKDLYYRLNVIPINFPSLRSRRSDVPMLADYFIIRACAKQKKSVLMLSEQIKESLSLYNWPGNVGELKKAMVRIASFGDESCVYVNKDIPKSKRDPREQIFNKIDERALPDAFEIQKYLPALKTLSLKNICNEFVSRTEKRLMQKALESTNWNRKKAAELLNISYKSMLNKMKMYEIS